MDRAVGDQEKIMGMRGDRVHKSLDVQRCSGPETPFEFGAERLWLNVCLEPQKNTRAQLTVQDVIGFILRDILTEMLTDVFRSWVTLNGEISTFNGI
jgi:hypothetical protein